MTAHECDDTAYPAAAMPDECTCGGLQTMTDPTAAETLPAYMASRAETIGKLYAADEDCAYTLDGHDTDGTPWFRCSTHNETAMGSKDGANAYPPDVPCNGWRSDEDGYALGDGSEYSARESAEQRLMEMPLSVEVIRHVKILLGTGGPADWLDAELDADDEIRVLEYHYADWGTHAQTYVEKGTPLWRFAETFTSIAAES
jgi:hypothetical protein